MRTWQQAAIGLTLCAAGLGRSASAAEPTSTPYVWKNAQIVGGGFVSGIITHPKEKGLIYCKTDIGGAYRWDAGQGAWTSISDWIDPDHWNYTGTESLALDESDPNKVYIAAGSYTNSWGGNGAILRSNDQGHSWKVAELSIKLGGNEDGRNNGERLAVDPNDGRVLYLASRRNGLWHSTDSGETWQQVAGFPEKGDPNGQGLTYILFDRSTGSAGSLSQSIYVGSSTGPTLYHSADAGSTWTPVDGAPTGLFPHRAAWGKDRELYLTYGNGPGPNGVSDGCVKRLDVATGVWTDVTPVKPGNGSTFGYSGITVDPQHPGTVMVSTLDRWWPGDDLFRSTDDGKTWHSLAKDAPHDFTIAPWLKFHQKTQPNGPMGHWINSVEIDPSDPDHCLYTTGWGMWETNDLTAVDHGQPTHWHPGAQGVEELVVNQVVSPSSGAPVLSAVWDVDGFRHSTLTHSPPDAFYQPDIGRNTCIDVAGKNPEVAARVYGGQILGHDFGTMTGGAVSNDNGETWQPFATRPGQAIDGTIAVSADGKMLVWSPDGGPPSVSDDLGKTWTPAANLPAKSLVVSDRADPTRFYAFDASAGTVWFSTDGGRTFNTGAKNLPTGDSDLRAALDQPGDVWLASSKGLLHSTDGGATFQPVDTVQHAYHIGFGRPAPGAAFPAIYINAKIEGAYGFYRSDDAGKTWTRINDDQHNFGQISSITGDPRRYGRMYAGSSNRGILYGDPQ